MKLGVVIPPPKGGGRSAKPTGWGRKHRFPGANNNPTPRARRTRVFPSSAGYKNWSKSETSDVDCATLPFQGRDKP